MLDSHLIPVGGALSQNFMFLCENGDFVVFGENSSGQGGTGDNKDLYSPKVVLNNPNIKYIQSGYYKSFYIEYSGDLYVSGSNTYYSLGVKNSVINKFAKAESNVKRISVGTNFAIIQKEDDKLYFIGNAMGLSSKDKFIHITDDVDTFTCGGTHALIKKHNNEIYVMGTNNYGELGLPLFKNKTLSVPTLLMKCDNFMSFCCGYNHSVILVREETGTELIVFGKNDSGMLGIGTNSNVFAPTRITDFKDIKSIHSGGDHTIILLETGYAYSCGSNGGQLGLGERASVNVFTQISLPNVRYIVTGFYQSLFVDDNGKIYTCGCGGRLGLGDQDKRSYPTEVPYFGKIKLLMNHEFSPVWTPASHKNFSRQFKIGVAAFITCMKIISAHSKNKLKVPKPLLHLIIGFQLKIKKESFKDQPKTKIHVFKN